MRVAFVIERYWPLMTASGWVLDPLLRYLKQRGHEVSVLTAQVDRLWPETITVRDVPLRRFGHDAWNLFSRLTLGQRIAKWLAANPESWDGVVVWEQVEGAEQVWQAAQSLARPCVWVSCEGGPDSHLGRLLSRDQPRGAGHLGRGRVGERRAGERRPVGAHPYWVVPHAAAARDLQELYPTAEIRCWNLGLPEFRPLAVKDRRVIRDQLTGSQAALARERASPLVVYYGHGLAGPDSRWLWKLLSRMAERRADWTAWILGTGPAWHGLWRSAMEAGLEDRIVFPGDFGDLADVIAAADLVLFPQTQKWLTYPWLLTVAAQTPHLISRTEGVLEVIRRASGEVGELEPEWSNVLPSGDLEAWVAAAESLLECAEGVHRQLRWQRSVLAGVGSQLASLADFEQGLLQWFGRHERR